MIQQTPQQQIAELEQQLAEMQTQLMQAQKMSSVGALSSSITHEFNNILTTVINYAKMGLRHKDAKIKEKSFNKILSAGQRAAKITTGMLSYARNNGDQKENIEMVGLVNSVLSLIEKDLQMNRVRLETNFDSQPFAEVNANQIQQVLLNLIVNGRQAMDGGGTLTIGVGTNEKDGFAEISVRDTGSGIPKDKLPKIFDSFFSTKTADSQGQGGTGLGLSLCNDIIEDHKGRIRVESTIGKGTMFTLKFPLVAEPKKATITRRASAGTQMMPKAG